MTDPTTPGTPVPPDELRSRWINDSAILSPGATGGPMLRIGTDWKIVVNKAAAWGYAQAMQEREELAIEAYQSGYARGHNDTVEGCYNLAAESEPEAAEEVIAELVEDRARAAAERLRGGES
jgi:hypothetical protein